MKLIRNNREKDLFLQGLSQEEWLVQLMERYEDKVIRLAYTYVKDRKLAEDLTQEVFVKCFIHKENFRSESSVKTWVYAITVNICKDYLRSGWKKYIHIIDRLGKSKQSSALTPELTIVQKSEYEALADEVLKLPLKYREVILLFYYKELSVSEISQILHKKEPTIRTLLQRGREMLRRKLEKGR
ncbi:sigma-70 family RNA polymerase sigma factor [Fictibacillus phosphorivorans]|uniref:sigma-70 family RNA polymerase sigma factor n=1 Tax=Fictibacillus phosphorivorans TaxID=1221500 RepID=UPI00203C1B63|nr:sigma-70 family RNA polymerase sigma factor [Fictibacillus phosphorivorans]MCM3718208.1 sigma-70 family RNA polymerase sigma factor [Fictibacillus phosphorivorans]MCM3775925.1 sigma-70 family RNA polymerase sigma factor [Fictibacillus phosphorivorans]